MKLYGIVNCDTVKKARKQLDEEGRAYEFVDLKTTVLSSEQIRQWLQQLPETLINKRSMTYRSIKADWLASADNIDRQIALIKANPTVIKRPLIETEDGKITVGF